MGVSDVCIYDIGKVLSEVEDAWSWIDGAQKRVKYFENILRQYEAATDKRTVAPKLRRAFEDAEIAIGYLEKEIDDVEKALEEVVSSCGSIPLMENKIREVQYLKKRVGELRERLERAYRDKAGFEAKIAYIALNEEEYSLRDILNKVAWFVKYLGRKAVGRD